MIGYVTLGTNDLARASAFYDALLGQMGAARAMQGERYVSWSTGKGQPLLFAIVPFDGKPATVGNGVMVALTCKDRAQVDALHARALALGALDEGAPGDRGGGFYAAYFRDLDGNKLALFHT